MARSKPRWGRLTEIDKRIHVGTKTWDGLPNRLRHLTAWRRMNSKGHMPVRMAGTRMKVRPSSNMNLKTKLRYVQEKINLSREKTK